MENGENGQEKIIAFYRKRRRMPTIRELMALMGYQSTGATAYYAEKLIEAGFLAKDKATGTLIPGHTFGEAGKIKVLGLVEAGFPSAAEEELLDVMDFDEYLVPNKESSYILKVKGDSMIDAGIQPGDMVVVERRASYKPGQIVIAMIDGEYTMKYLRKSPAGRSASGGKGGEYFLEPGNAAYKPIYPRESFRVEAVVTAVVRKY